MKPRHKRFAFIGLGLVVLGVATVLILNAFQSNLVFFFTPTQVVSGEAPHGRSFRIGGMVEDGSLVRENDGLTVHFIVTDTAKRVPVTFSITTWYFCPVTSPGTLQISPALGVPAPLWK